MKKIVCLICLAALAAACSRQPAVPVRFSRLDQLLFEQPADRLKPALEARRAEYDTPLLNLDTDNPASMAALREFVSDPGMRFVYHVADSLYHDLGWLEHDLGEALGRAAKLLPDLRYRRFYTLVTGDFEDYSKRVFCDQHDLAVSLDHYAAGHLGNAVPAYLERLCRPEYMAADCLSAMAAAHIVRPQAEPTLLDYAVCEGKKLYFTQKAMPKIADTILLRYSPDQLQWARRYVGEVWATLVREKLLYSHDLGRFHNMIDDAPKTNAFGDGSAPRMPAYIGLLIVSRYMEKSGATMQELFAESDSQRILTTSGWRP